MVCLTSLFLFISFHTLFPCSSFMSQLFSSSADSSHIFLLSSPYYNSLFSSHLLLLLSSLSFQFIPLSSSTLTSCLSLIPVSGSWPVSMNNGRDAAHLLLFYLLLCLLFIFPYLFALPSIHPHVSLQFYPQP